ncbi:MAG TPA: hypothetical protein VMX55_04040 [candidate division Zixibacteria bacterium]|nr:hypothetical protein [candidate division Zixibacteria bacterium]
MAYNLDIRDIPDDKIMSHPLVQELSQALDLSKYEFPLILKNKTLMEEGTWNNHYYSADSIAKALSMTDWSDRNNNDLFYDHDDTKASELIGSVENLKMFGKKLIGDLKIFDLASAIKLQVGRPKIGISPKVLGKNNSKTNEIFDFVFGNFSVVYNPAIKTAYINNSESVDEKDLGKDLIMENDSYSTKVEEKPVEIKEDIKVNDGVVIDEKAIEIKVKGGDVKMAEEEEKKEGEVAPETKDEQPTGETEKKEEKPVEKEAEPVAQSKEPSKEETELSDLDSKIGTLKAMLGELEVKKETLLPKQETSEVSTKLSAFEAKLDSFIKLTEERTSKLVDSQALIPDKRSVNASTPTSNDRAKINLSEIEKDPDAAMHKVFLQVMDGGSMI